MVQSTVKIYSLLWFNEISSRSDKTSATQHTGKHWGKLIKCPNKHEISWTVKRVNFKIDHIVPAELLFSFFLFPLLSYCFGLGLVWCCLVFPPQPLRSTEKSGVFPCPFLQTLSLPSLHQLVPPAQKQADLRGKANIPWANWFCLFITLCQTHLER